jgi:hypothetical protein
LLFFYFLNVFLLNEYKKRGEINLQIQFGALRFQIGAVFMEIGALQFEIGAICLGLGALQLEIGAFGAKIGAV